LKRGRARRRASICDAIRASARISAPTSAFSLTRSTRGLPAETGVDVAAIVANRVLTPWLDADGQQLAATLATAPALDVLAAAAGPGVGTVLEAERIADARSRTGGAHLRRLTDAGDVPVLHVPELFTRATGRRVVTLVADALAAIGVEGNADG